jgi:hypothetical protein
VTGAQARPRHYHRSAVTKTAHQQSQAFNADLKPLACDVYACRIDGDAALVILWLSLIVDEWMKGY